jgi:DNA polymerase-3 subunit alpha
MITFPELVSRISFLKIPAVAVTDHWTTYGHFEFHQLAREAGIKPIFGSEIRHGSFLGGDGFYHLTILAENETGYRNLCRIVSAHYEKGKEQFVTPQELVEHNEGLIVLSGCIHGEAAQSILHGNLGREREVVQRLLDIFGESNLFIEIQNHTLPEERLVLDHLTIQANRLGLPLVVTNNDRYLLQDESRFHELLLMIRDKGEDEKQPPLPPEYYLKREKDIEPLFYSSAEAVHQSGLIAERCNADVFDRRKIVFSPVLEPEETLREMCKRRFLLKFHSKPRDETASLRRSMEKELECASKEGLGDFILFLRELFQSALHKGIWLEVMGGNLLESIVAFMLGIVPLNPAEYGLALETFSSSQQGVPSSLELVTSKESKETFFGLVKHHLSGYIPSFQVQQEEMSFHTIAKEILELRGAPENIREELVRLLIFDRKQKTLVNILEHSEPLMHLYNSDSDVREALHAAQALHGRICHFHLNASRLVVFPACTEEIVSFVTSSDNGRFALCSNAAIESLGGWLLGIQHSHFLSAIDETVKQMKIEANGGMATENDQGIGRWLPETMNDPQTFSLITSGETTGIYLLESRGIRDLIEKIKPTDFSELINVISLYRPAPLEGKLWERYIDNAEKKGKVFLPHHFLAASLESTRGLLLYEEQVREILAYTAGLECDRTVVIENALKSKDTGKLFNARLEFIRGAMDSGVDEEDAQKIFDYLLHHVAYTHSKALSCSQAYLTYRTAFLKAHRFEQYFTALLNSNMDVKDRQKRYMKYLADVGIEILPADINASDFVFKLEETGIRAPLRAGKSVDQNELQAILEERDAKGEFQGLRDFIERMFERVSLRAVLELVEEGAFHPFGSSKEELEKLCKDFYEDGGKVEFFTQTPVRPAPVKKKKQPDTQLSFFDDDQSEDRA